MRGHFWKFVWAVVCTAIHGSVLACNDSEEAPLGPSNAPNGVSRAFSAWTPSATDTCSPQVHDRYAVVGPDGKLYPAWHPPVDPESGCTFGHEHGRDPRGSDLFDDVGFIPFGYANEVADLFAPHPGYKLEWENDVDMRVGLGDVGAALFAIQCDVMVELHQGSSGSGAFVNPQHELAYHARCSDGTEIHFQIVSTIGHQGEFVRGCESDAHIVVDPTGGREGGGKRLIPDRTCVERFILLPEDQRSRFSSGLRESWQMSQSIRTADGRSVASVGPYFNVFNPVRYYDPAKPDLVGHSVELCFEVLPNGNRATGGLCEGIAASQPMAWNDPASPFNGGHRDVDINSIRIRNEKGPEVWYTDAYGKNARTQPFPGSIKQFIAKIDNEVVTPSGPSIGRDRNYGVPGVHAPN